MKFTKNLIFLALLATIAFSQCADGEDGETRIPVGNLCLTASELDICNQNLGDLDHKEEENDSITNICEPLIEDGKQIYEFTVQFQNDFVPNLDCLSFEVGFENNLLDEGSALYNEWTYDETNYNIKFKITHEEINDLYNCEFISDDDQYTWICDMHTTLLFGGSEQLRYEFQIQITLGRSISADTTADGENLSVNVVKNTVQGICCENELNIETALRFCTDFTCTDHLPSPLSIQRGEEFVVEHYIVSSEFQNYHLEGQRIKLGPFFPTVVEQDGTNAGKYIWKIKSNIALDDLVIESISLLTQGPPTLLRRFLQELRDDYKVKASGSMSIVTTTQEIEEDKKIVYVQQEDSSDNNNVLSIALISVGVVVVISIIGAIAYYLKSKKNLSSSAAAKKYTEKELQQV